MQEASEKDNFSKHAETGAGRGKFSEKKMLTWISKEISRTSKSGQNVPRLYKEAKEETKMTATKTGNKRSKQVVASESIIRKLSLYIDIYLPEQCTNIQISDTGAFLLICQGNTQSLKMIPRMTSSQGIILLVVSTFQDLH